MSLGTYINYGDCITIGWYNTGNDWDGDVFYLDPTNIEVNGTHINQLARSSTSRTFKIIQTFNSVGCGPVYYNSIFYLIPTQPNSNGSLSYFMSSSYPIPTDDWEALMSSYYPVSPNIMMPFIIRSGILDFGVGTSPVPYDSQLVLGIAIGDLNLDNQAYIYPWSDYFYIYGQEYIDNEGSSININNLYASFHYVTGGSGGCMTTILPDSTQPTKCGRPSPYYTPLYTNDPSVNAPNGIASGDLNYGYVKHQCIPMTEGIVMGDLNNSATCNSYNGNTYLPAAGSSPNVGGSVLACNTFGGYLYPNGGLPGQFPTQSCNNFGAHPCPASYSARTGYISGDFQLCGSQWTTQSANKIQCCAGMLSGSADCDPLSCPTYSSNGDSCPLLMNTSCNSSVWNGTNPTSLACDQYVNLVSSSSNTNIPYSTNITNYCSSNLSNCNMGGAQVAQCMIYNNVYDFYITNNNTPFTQDPFVGKSVDLCNKFPGLCDSILNQVCSAYTIDDLSPLNNQTSLDPNGIIPLQLCGCHLPSSQYSDVPSNNNIACSTICRYPGVVPQGDDNGNVNTCTDNVCVIDDITATSINSTGGTININTICGPNSQCYFNGISSDNLSNNSFNIVTSTQCGACYTINPDDPTQTTQVDCKTLQPITSTTLSRREGFGGFNGNVKDKDNNMLLWIIIFSVLLFLIECMILRYNKGNIFNTTNYIFFMVVLLIVFIFFIKGQV
jgi:hypothetical protein